MHIQDNTIAISAEELNLQPAGGIYDDHLASVLKGEMRIAGCPFHVRAIEVDLGAYGSMTALNPRFQSDIEALYALTGATTGSTPSTVTIDGRLYAIMVFPRLS